MKPYERRTGWGAPIESGPPGRTGRPAAGVPVLPGDEEIRIAVGHNAQIQKVIMMFGVEVEWVAMTLDQAEGIAQDLLTHVQKARAERDQSRGSQ